MKKINLLLLSLFIGISSFAQSGKDAILGDWYNQEKDAIIKIYREDGKYHGKITWMLNPLDENGNPKTDPLNPDKSLQSRSRMGMIIMYNFKYDGDNEWDDGSIYDPKSGNEYSGTMTLTSENRLDLRGYVGIPLFGRTSNWSRKLD
mgnify:CR=1 FL=1|tara:strand:+ start:765 stop:1205 length:441 start_codon:yes stop_codon:yes gene_type:complete